MSSLKVFLINYSLIMRFPRKPKQHHMASQRTDWVAFHQLLQYSSCSIYLKVTPATSGQLKEIVLVWVWLTGKLCVPLNRAVSENRDATKCGTISILPEIITPLVFQYNPEVLVSVNL